MLDHAWNLFDSPPAPLVVDGVEDAFPHESYDVPTEEYNNQPDVASRSRMHSDFSGGGYDISADDDDNPNVPVQSASAPLPPRVLRGYSASMQCQRAAANDVPALSLHSGLATGYEEPSLHDTFEDDSYASITATSAPAPMRALPGRPLPSESSTPAPEAATILPCVCTADASATSTASVEAPSVSTTVPPPAEAVECSDAPCRLSAAAQLRRRVLEARGNSEAEECDGLRVGEHSIVCECMGLRGGGCRRGSVVSRNGDQSETRLQTRSTARHRFHQLCSEYFPLLISPYLCHLLHQADRPAGDVDVTDAKMAQGAHAGRAAGGDNSAFVSASTLAQRSDRVSTGD